MKKIILSAALVIAFGGYAFYQHTQNQSLSPTLTTQVPQTTTSQPSDTASGGTPPTPTSTTPQTTPPVATTPTPVVPKGQFKDGEYTGIVADAFYGNLQVKAVISSGKLSDVQFIQYPNDRGESRQINQNAAPILRSEAIAAQSGQVDVVSGATQSSEAFVQSLQSALNQAKS